MKKTESGALQLLHQNPPECTGALRGQDASYQFLSQNSTGHVTGPIPVPKAPEVAENVA